MIEWGFGIATFVVIIGTAIALRTGWRPTWRRPATPTTAQTAPAAPAHGGHGGNANAPLTWWQRAKVTTVVIFLCGCVGMCTYANVKHASLIPPPTRVVVYMPAPSLVTPPEDPQYPHSGSGVATKSAPLKVWLDTRKSAYRSGSVPVRLQSIEDPSKVFDDYGQKGRIDHSTDAEWRAMPTGRYLVTPLKDEKLTFVWCMYCSLLEGR